MSSRNCLVLQKMDSIEKQEAELLRELNSRSKAKVTLESALYVLIVLFLFVGNSLTFLVILLNRRMRTIPNVLVALLAVSDFFIGVFSADPSAIPTLVTSHWPFNDTTCQFQGYLAVRCVALPFTHWSWWQWTDIIESSNRQSTDDTSPRRKLLPWYLWHGSLVFALH